jgi:hypothetical protein
MVALVWSQVCACYNCLCPRKFYYGSFMFICSCVFKIKNIEREREKNYVYVKEHVLYVCLCEKG